MSPSHFMISEKWTGASGHRWHTWAQQEVGTTRKEVVRQIVNGELDPFQIYEVIPDESVVNDVTADIALEVRDWVTDNGEGCPDHLVDFIESNVPGFVTRAA